MIIKTKQEAAEYGVQEVDVENILIELQNWQWHLHDDGCEDAVRYAMINTFEDIILNSLVEG